MTQLTLKYPNVPGFKGTKTSSDAAAAAEPSAPLLRSRALEVIRNLGPLTADEVADQLAESILAIRPRISELKRQGKIKDAGQRRANRSGRTAMVLTINE